MNESNCPCCGQLRPFPTEPGEWEYCESPYMTPQFWTCANVKRPEHDDDDGPDGLRLWKDGQKIWWPNHAAWRKVS